MGKRRGKTARKAKREQAERGEDEELVHAPHSFVIQRGKVGRSVKELVRNVRRVMSPYTAESLRERKRGMLKDYVAIAGPLNVSHLIAFSKTEKSVNLRICRLPRGPTLTFQVKGFSLIRDLAQTIRKHDDNPKYFLHHPLLVMNNFSKSEKHLKLTASMFQNMFPSINISKVKLKRIKRVALVNYDSETGLIDFRHYHLRVVPVGLSKPVSKLYKHKIPQLAKYEDISQFLLNPGALSESEAELDGEHNEVELPQTMDGGKGNLKHAQSAIRLREIGPRLTLNLIKITNGVCDGEVLYHKFIKKTEQEIADLQKRRAEKKQLKEMRRQQQAERVKQKQAAKEAEREKSRLSAKKVRIAENGDKDAGGEDKADAAYYEEEVGSKPEAGLFPTVKSAQKRRASSVPKGRPKKERHVPETGRKQQMPFTGGITTPKQKGKQNPRSLEQRRQRPGPGSKPSHLGRNERRQNSWKDKQRGSFKPKQRFKRK